MACPTGKLVVNSKDPRINYNLLPGEELLTCPYNMAHAILPLKFPGHVLKCHKAHVKAQKEKGQESLFAICQYDRSHHVRKEEIAFHESKCRKLKTLEDEGWGWDDKDGCQSVYKWDDDIDPNNELISKVGAAGGFVPPPPPPKPKEEVVIECEEDWETEPEYKAKFDPDQKILECRKSGYNVVQTHKVVGMTRSEKKEFYKRDAQEMEELERKAAIKVLRDRCTVGRSRSGASTSKYGSSNADDVLSLSSFASSRKN